MAQVNINKQLAIIIFCKSLTKDTQVDFKKLLDDKKLLDKKLKEYSQKINYLNLSQKIFGGETLQEWVSLHELNILKKENPTLTILQNNIDKSRYLIEKKVINHSTFFRELCRKILNNLPITITEIVYNRLVELLNLDESLITHNQKSESVVGVKAKSYTRHKWYLYLRKSFTEESHEIGGIIQSLFTLGENGKAQLSFLKVDSKSSQEIVNYIGSFQFVNPQGEDHPSGEYLKIELSTETNERPLSAILYIGSLEAELALGIYNRIASEGKLEGGTIMLERINEDIHHPHANFIYIEIDSSHDKIKPIIKEYFRTKEQNTINVPKITHYAGLVKWFNE